MDTNNNNFKFYTGNEVESFSFFKIPKALFSDDRFKELSSEAKILYGLMLDRLSLSIKNNWHDEDGRIYIIYKIDSIMKDLNCKKDKAILVLSELDEKMGVGLIRKVKVGFGMPNRIYVKMLNDDENKPTKKTIKTKSKIKKVDNDNVSMNVDNYVESSVDKVGITCGKQNTDELSDFNSREFRHQYSDKNTSMVGESDTNKTKYNKTEYSKSNHINHTKGREKDYLTVENDMIDCEAMQYIELVKENIEYDHCMQVGKQEDVELYDELFQLICDVVCVKRDTVRVNGQNYPYSLVKSKFLKLTSKHLNYVIRCMSKTTTKIHNIRAYMMTALFNAQNTVNHYWQQEVQSTMYANV